MTWLFKRLLQSLPLIWGLVTLLFILFNLLGDPVRMVAGQRSDMATLESIRARLHIDRPLWQQYLWYLNDLSPIGISEVSYPPSGAYHVFHTSGDIHWVIRQPDLRYSFQTQRPVSSMIAEKIPGTMILAILSMCLAVFLGVSLGLWAAVKKDTFWDRGFSFIAMLGVSTPSFVSAVLFIWIFAIWAGDYSGLPISGYWIEEEIFGTGKVMYPSALVLPCLALGIRPLSVILQLTRSSMLEVLNQDYIRTARAKGLSAFIVLFRHALINALNPVITAVSGWFASLLAGVFFIEFMFDWQGLGKLTMDALSKNDYPVLSGCILFIGLVFVCMNIVADALYMLTDPRIKLKS